MWNQIYLAQEGNVCTNFYMFTDNGRLLSSSKASRIIDLLLKVIPALTCAVKCPCEPVSVLHQRGLLENSRLPICYANLCLKQCVKSFWQHRTCQKGNAFQVLSDSLVAVKFEESISPRSNLYSLKTPLLQPQATPPGHPSRPVQ